MFYIPIILGSIRRGRQSPKVAHFISERMQQTGKIETEILDLMEHNFPMMEERLRLRNDPPARLQEFSDKIAAADALVIVTPEYNSGYPAPLKNALDYLFPEFKRKPVGVISVSGGSFGGLTALAELRTVLLAMGALPIPIRFPIANVEKTFNDAGVPNDPIYESSAQAFLDELLWLTEAIVAQKSKEK
ncbi:MAG: NAD(P)H-dependent oxidoreductase [candidate division Zixibacteria bacterium]|nr:NAD(P)H-dependent oxidoreductase [candidate division Zixibacteria bacterium]